MTLCAFFFENVKNIFLLGEILFIAYLYESSKNKIFWKKIFLDFFGNFLENWGGGREPDILAIKIMMNEHVHRGYINSRLKKMV